MRPFLPTTLLLGATALTLSSCVTRSNYLDPAGPRYAADYAAAGAPEGGGLPWTLGVPDDGRPIAALASTAPAAAAGVGGTLKVVSYNLRYGEQVDRAIEVLSGTPELADADVVLLQEMNAVGVDRIARELGFSYVYYPASLRASGRDFGNAVLTRGRILDDRKVALPHVNPLNRQARIAVRAELELDAGALAAYSVHTEMPLLALDDREDQIDVLLASADGAGPCLIAGDFNTMSARSRGSFERAFAAQGFELATDGLGTTFTYGPFRYALDHVFVRDLRVVRSGKVDVDGVSDHVPIWVELAHLRRPDLPSPGPCWGDA